MTETVATALVLPSVNCGSDAIMRVLSSIQHFLVELQFIMDHFFQVKEFFRAKENNQGRCKGSTASILTKTESQICDIMSVLDVERQFQCSVRQ